MCLPGQAPPVPETATEAAAMARAALGWLAAADAASLTLAEQAECLRALEQAGSMHTAARARVAPGRVSTSCGPPLRTSAWLESSAAPKRYFEN